MMNRFCQSLAPLLSPGSTVFNPLQPRPKNEGVVSMLKAKWQISHE